MIARCCCQNCGFVDDYTLPYRAQIIQYQEPDDAIVIEGSRMELEDGTVRPLICENCGWDRLQVVYWNKEKVGDPLDAVHLSRG